MATPQVRGGSGGWGRIKEGKRIINVYTPQQSFKIQETKLTKVKGQIDNSTIIAGNVIIPLPIADRTTKLLKPARI